MARPRHARVLLSLDVSALSHLTRCILSLFIVSHHYCWVSLFEVNWSLSTKGEKLQAAADWGVGWLEHSARDRLLYLGSSQHGSRLVGEGPTKSDKCSSFCVHCTSADLAAITRECSQISTATLNPQNCPEPSCSD